MTMWLARWNNNLDILTLVESSDPIVEAAEVRASDLDKWLLDPDFDGVLWNNKGLKWVLTRDILQEGLDIYRMAHLNSRGPIASHVGVFLWDQTISREEADQRSKASTSDGTAPEDESDQGPLEA